MNARRVWSLLCVGFAVAGLRGACGAQTVKKPGPGATAPAAKDGAGHSGPLWEALERALQDEDGHVGEKALMDGWEKDAAWGEKAATELLQGRNMPQRVLGAVALARRAEVARLAELAKSLKETEFPDERRVLVRAIGTRYLATNKDAKERAKLDAGTAAALLEPFLSDREVLVKAAAIQAFADLGDPKAVGKWVPNLRDVPAYSNTKNPGDADVLNRAMYGSAYALSGVRAKKAADVREWWNATHGEEKAKSPGDLYAETKAEQWNGAAYYPSPAFDIYFRITGVKGLPSDGQLEWSKLSKAFEAGRLLACARMGAIVGRVHSTPVRLYVADKQQFSALATTTSFAGVTQGNEIVLQLQSLNAMTSTLAHEYVHWIQMSWFTNQPRWLAEGLAMSLSDLRPRDEPRGVPAAGSEVRKMVEAGTFSQMFNWNSGGSSDSKEAARYQLAKLAIDFLRNGPFSVPEERLGFFIGRVDRREAGPRALELTYGYNVKQMDAMAKAWIEGGAAEPKPDKR